LLDVCYLISFMFMESRVTYRQSDFDNSLLPVMHLDLLGQHIQYKPPVLLADHRFGIIVSLTKASSTLELHRHVTLNPVKSPNPQPYQISLPSCFTMYIDVPLKTERQAHNHQSIAQGIILPCLIRDLHWQLRMLKKSRRRLVWVRRFEWKTSVQMRKIGP
jgi:hypothetical protein